MCSFRLPTKVAYTSPVIVSFDACGNTFTVCVAVHPILICLVNHPELNREVLVANRHKTGRGATAFETIRWMMGDGLTASTGAFHLRQPRLIQPRFHHMRIESYARSMIDFSARKSSSGETGPWWTWSRRCGS